jgi:hypothetical protein
MTCCIFIGLLVDLGWKEISSGYKRNFQNQTLLDDFQPKVELRSLDFLIHEAEEEYRRLMTSTSQWITYWNSTEAIIDSKPLSGSISITEVPLIRIRANCSCQSSQQILKQLFSPRGFHLFHSVFLSLLSSLSRKSLVAHLSTHL